LSRSNRRHSATAATSIAASEAPFSITSSKLSKKPKILLVKNTKSNNKNRNISSNHKNNNKNKSLISKNRDTNRSKKLKKVDQKMYLMSSYF
jgi:hypothetical protein